MAFTFLVRNAIIMKEKKGSRGMRIHFIGICGSGQSAAAILAQSMGFDVDGCDKVVHGYYYESLEKNKIKVYQDHDVSHLDGVDICAVTPAVFDIDPDNTEVKLAKERGILMTWQEFLGKYLFAGKQLIAVSGTHGKSTTTIMLGRALEALGANPNVFAGTIYKEWNSGCYVGKGAWNVCEADEFNYNFLSYAPDILVVNNIEMDHPETFHSIDEVMDAFSKFLRNIKGLKTLIVNLESEKVRSLLRENMEWLKENEVHIVGHCRTKKSEWEGIKQIVYEIVDRNQSEMRIEGCNQVIHTNVKGQYNMENAASVACVLKSLGYQEEEIAKAIGMFTGINRRFELIGTNHGLLIYDDYAHHPTAIRSVLTVCNEQKDGEVWAVFEPHQISRLLLMFGEYANALALADHIIITKTHIGREIHSNLTPIEGERWIQTIGSNKTSYIEDYDEVCEFILENAQEKDIIIVIGAGESYKISRGLVNHE